MSTVSDLDGYRSYGTVPILPSYCLFPVGLVERLVVVQPGQTPPKREFAGTPTFCSVAAHRGDQPSAHDDLEAMVRIKHYCTIRVVLSAIRYPLSVTAANSRLIRCVLLGNGVVVAHLGGPSVVVYRQVRRRVPQDEGELRRAETMRSAGRTRAGGRHSTVPYRCPACATRLQRDSGDPHQNARPEGTVASWLCTM